MRPAILYTIKSQEILAGSIHSMFRCNISYPLFVPPGDEAIASMDGERIDIPVHHLVKVHRNGSREDKYIAIHPDLRELLEAPFVQMVEAAEKRERAADKLLQMAEQAMTNFNNEPWWRRIWIALRHGVRC